MVEYLLKRLFMMIPVLFGITLVSFFVIHLAPGSPVEIGMELNPKITPEARERLIKYYGLDKPLHVQYIIWLKKIVRLDFGNSFSQDHRPVIDKIKERIPVTLSINILSMLIIFIVALPIGIYSAIKQNTIFDRASTIFVFVGYSTPSFWLALLLMIVFGVNLRILPISGLYSINFASLSFGEKVIDLGRHLVLPLFVASFGGLAGLSRYMRSNLLEVIRQDYVIAARAKGLSERDVIYKHAVRNALIPVITILGLSIPELIGGSVIFESIFGIPGMGQLFYQSVMSRDYPVVMGILTIGAFLTLIGNLIADVCYAIVDPRVRLGE